MSGYQRPGWLAHKVLNPIVVLITRAGLSVGGSRLIEVRGRTSGLPRRTPVNVLSWDGHRYLVAPRGETEWVRNLRADEGRVALLLGARRELCRATEVTGDERLGALAAYLRRWKLEVGAFFHGVSPDAGEAAWRQEAEHHPTFRLELE